MLNESIVSNNEVSGSVSDGDVQLEFNDSVSSGDAGGSVSQENISSGISAGYTADTSAVGDDPSVVYIQTVPAESEFVDLWQADITELSTTDSLLLLILVVLILQLFFKRW